METWLDHTSHTYSALRSLLVVRIAVGEKRCAARVGYLEPRYPLSASPDVADTSKSYYFWPLTNHLFVLHYITIFRVPSYFLTHTNREKCLYRKTVASRSDRRQYGQQSGVLGKRQRQISAPPFHRKCAPCLSSRLTSTSTRPIEDCVVTFFVFDSCDSGQYMQNLILNKVAVVTASRKPQHSTGLPWQPCNTIKELRLTHGRPGRSPFSPSGCK